MNDVPAAIRTFVGILSTLHKDGWWPRMDDIFKSAATIIAAQRLSILELIEFLRDPRYRAALLQEVTGTPEWETFREEHEYFRKEFSEFSSANQQQQTQPVLNKIRGMITEPYLRAMLTAERDMLDLPGLWQEQKVILVHLSETLGKEGMSLLSGLLAHQLCIAALRFRAKTKVVLMLDEMGMQERFLGDAVKKVLSAARSYDLRVLAATQHLDQLSEGLKETLLTSTALRVFFRLGNDDAPKVARSLTVGLGRKPWRIAIGPPDKNDPEPRHSVSYRLVDAFDRPVTLSPNAWTKLQAVQQQTRLSETEDGRLLAELARAMEEAAIPRVYVIHSNSLRTEVAEFVRGVPGDCLRFAQPDTLRLVVSFPKPKVTIVEEKGEAERTNDVVRTLLHMPTQEAIAATDGGGTWRLRVVDVPFPSALPSPDAFLGNGQSAERIRQTYALRRATVEAKAGGFGADAADTTGRSEEGFAERRAPRRRTPPLALDPEPNAERAENTPAWTEKADDGSL